MAAKAKEPEPPRDPKPKEAKWRRDLHCPTRSQGAARKSRRRTSRRRPRQDAVGQAGRGGEGVRPRGDGWLRLGSKPWTNILVDGKETGLHTPQTHLKLGAGSHRITLTNPQFSIKETFSVDIKAGETETVIKDLRPQGGDSD